MHPTGAFFVLRGLMKSKKVCFYYIVIIILFVLAVFLRTKLYLANDIFSDDECRLALSMLNSGSIFYLGYAQSAPPVFVLLSKMITGLFGFTEHAAKFIPFVSGLGSVFLFYKVCAKYLNSCAGIAAGLFIFALSQPLISFSVIFKQYSLDVLAALLCLYYLPQIKVSELSFKKFAALCCGILLLPLISLPSLFFIAAFFAINSARNWKRVLVLSLPFAVLIGAYYFLSLAPSKADLYNYFPEYWNDGFWSFSLNEFLKLLVLNIRFYFLPNNLSLASIILMFWGIYLFIREKQYFVLLVFLFILLSSLLGLYPLSGRVGLYALPIFLLFILEPLDINNKTVILAGLFLILSVCKYDWNYIKNLTNTDYLVSYSPKKLMLIMMDKYNPKKDIVLCNPASSPSYLFYSSKYGFETKDIYEMPVDFSKDYLDGLERGRGYWLYLIKDYNRAQVFPMIFEWLKGQNVKYSKRERNSYLIYVEK